MHDGVGEDISFAFAVLLGVLLGADDESFGAVAFVDAVYHLVELPELLDVFGIEVEEILLQRAVGGDAEDDDASPLVEVALVVDAFQHLLRRLHDVDGGTAWRDKPLFQGLVERNTPTTVATVSCFLSFSAQRLA